MNSDAAMIPRKSMWQIYIACYLFVSSAILYTKEDNIRVTREWTQSLSLIYSLKMYTAFFFNCSRPMTFRNMFYTTCVFSNQSKCLDAVPHQSCFTLCGMRMSCCRLQPVTGEGGLVCSRSLSSGRTCSWCLLPKILYGDLEMLFLSFANKLLC